MATKKEIAAAAADNKAYLIAKQKLHVKMVEKSIKELQDKILDSLSILDTTPAGKLSALRVNSSLLKQTYVSIIGNFRSTFNASTKKIVDDFATANTQILKNFKMVKEVAKFTNVDEGMMRTLRDGSYQKYLNLGQDAQNKIVQSMYTQVIGGGQFSDLVNTINNTLVGSVAKGVVGSSLAQYSRLYARDMIMNYHNDVMLTKAEDLGMRYMQYIGTIMSRTRRFCIQRVGNTYSVDKINSWKGKWKGKAGPALTFRGGYNCRHHWQPVRKEWLDDKEVGMLDKLTPLNKKGELIKKKKPKAAPKPRKVVPDKVGGGIIPNAPTSKSISKGLTDLRKSNKYQDIVTNNTKLAETVIKENAIRDKIARDIKVSVRKLEGKQFLAKSLPEKKSITTKINEVKKPWYDQVSKAGKLEYHFRVGKSTLAAMESEFVQKAIIPPKGGTLKFDMNGAMSANQMKLVKKNVNKIQNMLHPSVIKKMPRIDIVYRKGVRASYQNGQIGSFAKRPPSITLGGVDTPTLVHEFGHAVESRAGYMSQSQEFLAKRSQGRIPTRIYKGSDEVGWKDGFFDHYCGKKYAHRSTEIISMGLEQMYRKPFTFFKQDPEYFNYILKVMWGK